MRYSKLFITAALLLFIGFGNSFSQKVGFLSSEDLRKYFPDAQQADQRVQSIVEEWKREIEDLKHRIEDLEFEIKKNRLIWSDEERQQNEERLTNMQREHVRMAKEKFEAGGEYDRTVQQIMEKVEEKIYAAVQEVAAEQGYDLIWDKSIQPLPYVNFKYDITVHVLRKLGVDVSKLEEELEKKIEKDPRNKRKSTRKAPSRSRSRSRVKDKDAQEIEPNQPDANKTDEAPEITPSSPGKPPVEPKEPEETEENKEKK